MLLPPRKSIKSQQRGLIGANIAAILFTPLEIPVLKAQLSFSVWPMKRKQDSGIFPAGNPPRRPREDPRLDQRKICFPRTIYAVYSFLRYAFPSHFPPPFILHPSSSCISREPTPVRSRSLHASHLSRPVLSRPVLSYPSFHRGEK